MNPTAALATTALGFRTEFRRPEYLATGTALDGLIQGFPRGAISDIAGPDSSGRTGLAYSVVAAATGNFEICAYIDTNDCFDPCSAAAAGIALDSLIWVRCGGRVEHAMKAADNLLHAGGFGVVVLDLCSVSQRDCGRIPISYWYRFRLAIENTPAILLVVGRAPMAKSCAALMLNTKRSKAIWMGAPGFRLLRGMDTGVSRRKPHRPGDLCHTLRLAV